MVFHGDYEVEFEIYEKTEGDWRSKFLGHMAGLNPDDAKARWIEAYENSATRNREIHALYPYEEWK